MDSKKIKDNAAKHFQTLAPWHPARQWLGLAEIPAYLKRLYGITVTYNTVRKWAKNGIHSTRRNKQRYLKCNRWANRWIMVNKTDLIAFLQEY